MTPLQKLHNKLVGIFSDYIRLKDTDTNGWNHCFICGRPFKWKETVCAHFIKCTFRLYTFDEINCHPTCPDCNRLDEICPNRYEDKMIEKYGIDKVNEMQIMKFTHRKFTRSDYEDMIKEYSNKVKLLKL